MITVKINNKEYQYPRESTWVDVAKEFQPEYKDDILLVRVNGRLTELHRHVKEGEVEFITLRDAPGVAAYQRSAVMLLLKAFYHVAGPENVDKVNVHFSVGKGLFIEPVGRFTLDQDLLDRVKAQMDLYVSKEMPIMKRNIPTEDAIELFHKHRMYDKEKLFRYRLVSGVNIYAMDNFEDYFYGHMVQNTGYIKHYGLQLYEDGLVLILPRSDVADPLPHFQPQKNLYSILWDSTQWGRQIGVENVADLNGLISDQGLAHLILIQEAHQERQIAEIAAQIAQRKSAKLVMIAGPSSSGKTTFSHRLSIQLEGLGLKPHPIEVDNYFVNREQSPRDAQGNYNFEALECLDVEQFNKDMSALLRGAEVELPRFNFQKGEREYRGDRLRLGPDDILVMEGIHCLNDKLSYSLPSDSKFKIYISALTQLNIDEHNRIPTTDGRLLRRMVRDARTRGATAQDTIRRWPSVRRGEEDNIFPFQEGADAMFNSALIYELAVLKPYAVPLLFSIPRDCPEYEEATRLLKFLDYFIGVSSEGIPNNSILREFIGGSCLKV
ncbi:MAG: nucleoside kinase [Oscillospiraceae bacterium]|nr:nucleoside kinase [Oscillospiraceae bacterium]